MTQLFGRSTAVVGVKIERRQFEAIFVLTHEDGRVDQRRVYIFH
jgi:hypothetical protein